MNNNYKDIVFFQNVDTIESEAPVSQVCISNISIIVYTKFCISKTAIEIAEK